MRKRLKQKKRLEPANVKSAEFHGEHPLEEMLASGYRQSANEKRVRIEILIGN